MGLAGYREAQERRWRYYTLQGTRLPCPLRDPEGLQQWLEVEQFVKSVWQWHEADVNIEGDIVPAKVLQLFRKLVENAIEACHLSGELMKERRRDISGSSLLLSNNLLPGCYLEHAFLHVTTHVLLSHSSL